MAPNIFRQIGKERGIFRNESALLPEHLPEELPCRERQMKEFAYCMAPAAEGKTPPSLVLAGPPGTGKTSLARVALKQLCEVSSQPQFVYINCWQNSSRYGILSALVVELGGMLPRRGIASDEVAAGLRELGRKSRRTLIVVLDEVDRLVAGGEGGVLYDLARAGEAYGMKACVVGITNDTELMAKLDERVRSSLSNRRIDFAPYSPIELKQILNERAKIAFFPNVLEDEVVPVCAAVGAKNGGDARIALGLLWAAGKKAEREGGQKVSVDDVKAVKEKAVGQAGTPAERKKGMLDDYDKKLVGVVDAAGKDGIDGAKLYGKMKAHDEGGRRTVRNHLAKLEGGGLIRSEETGEGSGHAKKYFVIMKN